MEKMTPYRRLLLFRELFIGLGVVAGTLMMFSDPTGRIFGMNPMLPLFKRLHFAAVLFNDFLFPGIALLLCNGLTNLVSFGLLMRRSRFASRAGVVCGLIMLGIGIQFYNFPLTSCQPPTSYSAPAKP